MNDPRDLYARAIEALNAGRWSEAQSLGTRLSLQIPDHAGVQFVAGVAAIELQQMGLAIGHLGRAVTLNPTRADYQAQLARVFAMARLFREAHAAADAAFALSPQDALTLDTLGVVYSQVNAHEQAIQVFRRAAELMPQIAGYRFNLGTSLVAIGDMAAAEKEYEACIGIDPNYWKAHLALAQLRKQSPANNHVERLGSILGANPADAGAQLYINLALAKEEEDLGDYAKAFDHLVAGKSSRRRLRAYDPSKDVALVDAILEAIPTPIDSGGGYRTDAPIFVVGMPRTGTTLVDRILSSHSQVHSAGELQNFSVALKRASGSTTRDLLDVDTIRHSHALDWASLGRAYVESTRPATARSPRFVDKLPHNFLLAGFIAKALPQAKIICLRREAMDTCLSNFRQLFALSSPYYDYSFDLLDTGRYYLQFDRLMTHWLRALPDRVMTVDYEAIVDAQEATTRKLLAFCDLPFEMACLRFEENAAPVATASAVQVRDGVSRIYMDRWRRYGERMDPLRALLEAGGIPVPR